MSRAPHLSIRSGLAFRRDPLAFLQSIDDGGDLIQFGAGLGEFTVIKSPESIHRVLVSDADSFGEGKWTLRGERVMGDCMITREGYPHRIRRALLQPGFERSRLDGKASALVERAERLGRGWRDGDEIEARAEMSQVALEAAGDAIFSLDLAGDSGALVPALGTMLHEIPRPGLPWPAGRRLAAARRVVDEVVLEAVAERRASPDGHDDVLALLISSNENGGDLSDRQIADEVASLMIAAIDTTPGTLAWAWYLLARHPEVESRVHEELDAVLDGRPATADDVGRLEYLEMVISEVLRLYPPVHFVDRRPLEDVELDGRRIQTGSFLLISPLLTQRDPRFYPSPASFRPERWTKEGRAGRPRYSYLPFGGGPHTCIGMALARMELALVMATLAHRWRMRPSPDFPADPSPQTGRFPMILEDRRPAVLGSTSPGSGAAASTRAAPNGALGERLDLLDGVIYSDLFDCAATAEEAWRFSRVSIDRAEFQRRLKEDPVLAGAISERDGLYCLVGREELLESRPGTRRRALRLRARARRVARLLQHIPFVRGLLLTGSAAADDARADADVDMLVIVSPGRLATAFTVLGGASRVLSVAVFCPNHYVSQAHPALLQQDLYVAHELVQAYPLAGEAELLRAANGWATELLPNSTDRTARVRPFPCGTTVQRLLEWPLRGRLGDALDRRLQPLALARLERHHRARGSSPQPDVADDLRTGVALRFHAAGHHKSVMLRYDQRREEVAALLSHPSQDVGTSAADA